MPFKEYLNILLFGGCVGGSGFGTCSAITRWDLCYRQSDWISPRARQPHRKIPVAVNKVEKIALGIMVVGCKTGPQFPA